jgi:hypothetical protein
MIDVLMVKRVLVVLDLERNQPQEVNPTNYNLVVPILV